MPRDTAVPQIDLSGIQDAAVRRALQAVVENFRVRNGEVGNGDNAFLTRADLKDLLGTENYRALTSEGTSTDPNTSGRRTTTAADMVRDLQNDIGGGPLSLRLAQTIGLITKPTTGLLARVGASEAYLQEERALRVNGDNALLSEVTTRWVQTGQNIAAVREEITLATNATSALALRVNTIQARIGNTPQDVGSIEQRFSIQATTNRRFEGMYSLQIDLAGYVTGFGLYGLNTPTGVSSQFLVRADTFAVGAPGPVGSPLSNLAQIPFIVRTVPTVINGVTRPPGVYMTQAVMGAFVADEGNIGLLSVDTLKIKGNAVTIPVTGNQAVDVTLSNFYTQLVSVSVQFDIAPQRALVLFNFNQYAVTFDSEGDLRCQIRRTTGGFTTVIYEGAVSMQKGFSYAYAASCSDQPGVGFHTYTLHALMTGTRSDRAGSGQLTVLGALR